MSPPQVPLGLATALAWAACVSYDPTGPSAAAINGVYAAEMITILRNDVQIRHDTAVVTVALRDSAYRGRFHGYYRFPDGDSGRVAGTLYPAAIERIKVSHFGDWPPVAHVASLRRLYTSCDFLRMNPMYIDGELRGDTLLIGGRGSLPCSYQADGSTVERDTALEFRVVGVRE